MDLAPPTKFLEIYLGMGAFVRGDGGGDMI